MKTYNKFLFSETAFDRSTKIRANASTLKNLINSSNTKHALVWKGKVLFDFSAKFPRIGLINKNNKFWKALDRTEIMNGHFVGIIEKTPIFYHDISNWEDPTADATAVNSFIDNSRNYHPAFPSFFAFCELRSLMTLITKTDAAILASIKGIYEWNKANNFCNNCGSRTNTILSGWEKICISCNKKHFPRTDPVVIMLIYHKDKVLLGRSAAWPKGMFSCLAGFMEPGESIESAVARETFEETGISIKNAKYVTSQPWPFPASLMIGCTAEAKTQKIVIDKDELEDARWFSTAQIREAIRVKGKWWPAREGSIARFLINEWVKETF